jgi:16S rRNA (cytosine967-C5)-methyltransferase
MTATLTARRVALDALVRIEAGAYAHILVPESLRRSRLPARDRHFVTELVYGAVRMQRALDFQLAKVSSQPLPALEPAVRAAIRLGAYQLFIGVPSHAAVSETVAAVDTRQRGFVNGVLRAVARNGPKYSWPSGTTTADIGVRTSHPDWIVELMVDEFGLENAITSLARADVAAPVTLRVNTRCATVDDVERELRDAGVQVTRGTLAPTALVLREAGEIGALAAVREGRATPQDQSSQAVATTLAVRPGERVADIAAAPGGKTAAIAEAMNDSGLVVASDISPSRMPLVARNATRLELTSVEPVVADGTRPPLRPQSFDRVLLDAPCSGLGVLRRRADARWRIRPDDVETLAALQRGLLVAAASLVRPGGRLVYAVCTVTPQETREIDEFARTELPQFVAAPPLAPPWRPHGRGSLILPADADSDGMFVLVLDRRRH